MNTKSLEVDFCVIGGGMAGVCAAIAAARNGAKVVLVQDRSVLGGNASSEIKMHIVGADCHGYRPGARETGLLEEFRIEDAYRNPHRSFPMWDLLLYEKVKENPNITLLLDSDCINCTTEKQGDSIRIISVEVLRNFTEDRFIITSRFFADCTGDGRLGFDAGADYRVGREAKSEFGESMAVEVSDKKTLGNSILFTAREYPTPQPFVCPSWARKFTKEELKNRPVYCFEYGYWWFEWGGHLDTLKDNDYIRHELLRIVLGVWDYIKNSGEHPKSANWALDWVGAIPGKREYRRFLGNHILTQQDVEGQRIFDDQVAYGGWWIDLHPPEGMDAVDEHPCRQTHNKGLYSIPLRSLYSRNVENLFFAGRNISATHVAFASTRVMGTCSVMGQAIGTAAAVLNQQKSSTSIARLSTPETIREIQQTLLKDDAFLLNIKNEDPADLARNATCTASAEVAGSPASNVISGVTRPIRPDFGTWAIESTHYWEASTVPSWLELQLEKTAPISELRITFCSGLERELILTPMDGISKKSVRAPQPEIIRDYDILIDGQVIEAVRGNVHRLRIHTLPTSKEGRTVRIQVLATQGLPAARIQQVRIYAKKS